MPAETKDHLTIQIGYPNAGNPGGGSVNSTVMDTTTMKSVWITRSALKIPDPELFPIPANSKWLKISPKSGGGTNLPISPPPDDSTGVNPTNSGEYEIITNATPLLTLYEGSWRQITLAFTNVTISTDVEKDNSFWAWLKATSDPVILFAANPPETGVSYFQG